LIHGAAGGVGSIAVQLAKWHGAKVIGTASGHNLDFLRELGVDQAIDYTTTPFEEVVKDADVVLDTIGGDTQERSWSVLKPGGFLASLVQPPSEEVATSYGVRQQLVGAYPPASGVLQEITSLVEAGHIKPVVGSVMTLPEIQKAHEIVEGRHMRGKLVLKVTD
jgi:NADPH:quinone reductase-like Zn-dependent oxidoreductase